MIPFGATGDHSEKDQAEPDGTGEGICYQRKQLCRRPRGAHYMPEGAARERCNGILYYQFLGKLLKNFDADQGQIIRELKEIQEKLCRKSDLVMSFTGTEKAYADFRQLTAASGSAAVQGKGARMVSGQFASREIRGIYHSVRGILCCAWRNRRIYR